MIARLALLSSAFFAGAAQATVVASIEAPGVQSTTKALAMKGVESLDYSPGYIASGTSDFGGSPVLVTGTNLRIDAANQYGGAGGTGSFATTYGTTSLTFTGAQVNYFGLWASALDGANSIAFFNGATQIAVFNLTATLSGQADAGDYRGNPNAPFAGQNRGEAYAFLNFVSESAFTRVDLIQNGGGGFEYDNLTIGATGAVPEPATWGMMLLGFGLVGGLARRRRAGRALVAA